MTEPVGARLVGRLKRLSQISMGRRLRPRLWHLAIIAPLLVVFYAAIDRRFVEERVALTMTAEDAATALLREHLAAKGEVRLDKGRLRAGTMYVADDSEIPNAVRGEAHVDCAVFEGRTPVATTMVVTEEGRRESLADANDEIVQRVLIGGGEFRGVTRALGREYLAVIRPLKDRGGGTIGMLAAYKELSTLDDDLLGFRALLAGSFIALFVAIALLSFISIRTIHEVELQSAEISRHRDREAAFFANLSHELRTPLAAIRGFAATLLGERRPDAVPGEAELTPRAAGMRIDREAADLLGLINNLLDFAKMRSGKVELLLEDVPVEKLVKRAATRAGALLGTKPIAIVIDAAPGLVVRCDFVKTMQVLTNLLANSVKFTERGAITVRVRENVQSMIDFEIEDTGCGIPAGALDKIWEPFQQADAGISLKHGGTGLGLPLVRGLVQQMGGTVSVRSRPGVGSSFRFSLPSATAPRPPA